MKRTNLDPSKLEHDFPIGLRVMTKNIKRQRNKNHIQEKINNHGWTWWRRDIHGLVDVKLVPNRHLHIVHLVDGRQRGQQIATVQLVRHHFQHGDDALRGQARIIGLGGLTLTPEKRTKGKLSLMRLCCTCGGDRNLGNQHKTHSWNQIEPFPCSLIHNKWLRNHSDVHWDRKRQCLPTKRRKTDPERDTSLSCPLLRHQWSCSRWTCLCLRRWCLCLSACPSSFASRNVLVEKCVTGADDFCVVGVKIVASGVWEGSPQRFKRRRCDMALLTSVNISKLFSRTHEPSMYVDWILVQIWSIFFYIFSQLVCAQNSFQNHASLCCHWSVGFLRRCQPSQVGACGEFRFFVVRSTLSLRKIYD